MSCPSCTPTTPSDRCQTPLPIVTIVKGDPGDNGAPGSQIIPGDSAPLESQGVDGDWFINELTGDTYYKSGGVWVHAMVIKGTSSMYLVGAGVPSDALGNDSDIYFDSTTNNLYYKSGGVWGASFANIKGDKGDEGDPGLEGPPGPPGNTIVYLATSAYFDPANPASEIFNNFPTTSGNKSLGTFDGPDGTYDIELTILVGWNTVGANNNRNLTAELKAGATVLHTMKSGSMKSGGTYGGVAGQTRIIRGVALTYGDVLTVAQGGTGDIWLCEANIKVLSPYTPYTP